MHSSCMNEYVREFGEGVDRMYREMEEAGLPDPEYNIIAFMVYATIKNRKYLINKDTPQDRILKYCEVPRSKSEIVVYMGYKDSRYFTNKYMKPLLNEVGC